jgi:hypothetical protein
MNFRLPRQAACLLALALLRAAAAEPAGSPGGVHVAVDFGAARDFLGIGAQLDLRYAHPEEELRLLRDLDAQFVRTSVVPAFRDDLPTGLSVERYCELLEAVAPQRAEAVARLRALIALHVRPHLVFWHMPKAWEKVTPQKAGREKDSHFAVDERIPDYAKLLAAELLWITRQGVEPFAIELTNEPQGAWDAQYTPEQYAGLVLATRRALDASHLQRIRIEGPGTGVRNWPEYLQALRSRDALGALAFISAHAYQTPEQIDDPSTPGYDEFMGRGRFGTILMTEYGIKRHNADEPELAAMDLDVESAQYGFTAGVESLQLLGKGASALIYWQLSDVEDKPKKHGALDGAGHRRPVAAALQALFGHLPAATRTAAGTGGSTDVPVQGFSADGRVWLLMANRSDVAQRVEARIAGASVHEVTGVDGYANGGLSSKAMSDAAVRGDAFSGILAPHALAAVALR